jgi:hypothetical protein
MEVRRYADPPQPNDLVAVEALRGGATVLMVASLERYLKDALEEFVELVAERAHITTHPNLPAKLIEYNDLNFFEWLVRESRLPRVEKTAELKRVSQLVATDNFVPEAFSRTRANPGPMTIRTLFNEFGISDAFRQIEARFGRHFQQPFPAGFVEATLGSIINKRNEVAHGGYSLMISRNDLRSWIAFLASFGKAADNTLRDYTLSLLATL